MKSTETRIIINTSFNATHCWPGCNIEEVLYLCNTHRHRFTVKVEIQVFHDDRDVEFINRKMAMDKHFAEVYNDKNLGHKSCEMICEEIMEKWPDVVYVEVLEDGENGASKKVKEVVRLMHKLQEYMKDNDYF